MQNWAKRRMLIVIFFIAVVFLVSLVFWVRGHPGVTLDGTLQTGPEQSAFFPDGDCSKTPFWFKLPDERDYDLNARLRALGYPKAVRVKLRAHVSSVGNYGHLGDYPREVQPIKVISVDPTTPCPWPGAH